MDRARHDGSTSAGKQVKRSVDTAGRALARRDMLIASGAGLAVAATPSCAQAPPVPASPKGAVEGASARAFGAIGDGQFHPLSSRYPTLAAARAVYPFAARLDQSLDWAGIQAAIDSVEGAGGTATIPVGRFLISDSLRLPSSVTLRGESRTGSILDNQNLRLNAPQIVNKDPVAFLYATIRDLTLHGGTHAIRVRATREVAGIVIEGITTNLQTEGDIVFSSMQTTMIRDCHLMDGRHGLSVEGFPCNSVHLDNIRLGRHTDAAIRLRGVDGFVMSGGSIEAGGVTGRGTIDIETGGAYANAVHFNNVYFENTHEYLLRSRGAHTIGFHQCKVTGTGAAGKGMAAYRFDCGDDLVVFSDTFWGHPTVGPRNMLLAGRNDGLGGGGNVWRERSGRGARLDSRRFAAADARRGLFAVDLGGAAGRVCGDVELMLDLGAGQRLRRVTLPIDLAFDSDGAVTEAASGGAVQFAVTATAGAARIALRASPALGDVQAVRCRIDLSADTAGAMTVRML